MTHVRWIMAAAYVSGRVVAVAPGGLRGIGRKVVGGGERGRGGGWVGHHFGEAVVVVKGLAGLDRKSVV